MKKLSNDQIATRDAVRSICRNYSNISISESVKGREEKYILMKIANVELFLYEDGEANIKLTSDKSFAGKAIEWRYELPDYKNTDELRTGLLNDLYELLQEQ